MTGGKRKPYHVRDQNRHRRHRDQAPHDEERPPRVRLGREVAVPDRQQRHVAEVQRLEVRHPLRAALRLPEDDGADAPQDPEGDGGQRQRVPPLEARRRVLDRAHRREAVFFRAEEERPRFADGDRVELGDHAFLLLFLRAARVVVRRLFVVGVVYTRRSGEVYGIEGGGDGGARAGVVEVLLGDALAELEGRCDGAVEGAAADFVDVLADDFLLAEVGGEFVDARHDETEDDDAADGVGEDETAGDVVGGCEVACEMVSLCCM